MHIDVIDEPFLLFLSDNQVFVKSWVLQSGLCFYMRSLDFKWAMMCLQVHIY